MARKDLRIEDLTAVIDTREQLPLNMYPMAEVVEGLQTGDYSLKGCEHLVAIERKSPSDYLGCVGQGRDRFNDELERIAAYRYRALVVECTAAQMRSGDPSIYGRSKVEPNAAMAMAGRWAMRGIPVWWAGSRSEAEFAVKMFLWLAAKELWEQALSLHPQLRIATHERDVGARSGGGNRTGA